MIPTPSFLEGYSTNENHAKMLSLLPPDIDASEGSHVWNLTRPSALIASEICEYILPRVLSLIFPEYSYGEYLDNHAKQRSMTRRAATFAIGEITINGVADAYIPAGSVFYTAAINDDPSVEYETLEDVTLPAEGSATARIRCRTAGTIGNTPQNTIIFSSGNGTKIRSVTNETAISGGTEEESDESLIARILEHDENQGYSFFGSISDYKRWAMSQEGVGSATVVPAQDDSGLITIIIADSNGQPATEQLCNSVYNYIMRPDNPEERLAPINANIVVVSPQNMPIYIKATVELKDGATIESAKLSFISKLSEYLPTATEEKEIKYTKIYSSLSAADGVNDFSNLQISIDNSAFVTKNIAITNMYLPIVTEEAIELTSGTV